MIKDLDLNVIHDVIVESNTNGVIIDVNDSIQHMFGYQKEEIVGKNFDILIPERFRNHHGSLFNGYKKNPSSRRMGNIGGRNFLGLNSNGKEFHVDISLSVRNNKNGDLSYFAIIRDISSLIDLNIKLINSNSELELKNEELESIAYMISHDLKAPTRSVIQLIDLIQEDHGETINSELKEVCEMIKGQNQNMSFLIDSILSFYKAGRVATDIQEVNVSEIIKEVIHSLNIPSEFKVQLRGENLKFVCPKTPFLQIMSNLIGNAIKYHDKKKGNVIIEAINKLDEVEIKVIDDGPGIPEKYHETIFNMFGTANQESRSDSTGIGLAIVKKLVNQNGGNIRVKSELGKGSEFSFTYKISNSNKV